MSSFLAMAQREVELQDERGRRVDCYQDDELKREASLGKSRRSMKKHVVRSARFEE